MSNKLPSACAAIGPQNSLSLFTIAGFDTYPAETHTVARVRLSEIKKMNIYGMVAVLESVAEEIANDPPGAPLPAVVIVPDPASDKVGAGEKRLRTLIRRAIGSDLPTLS